MNVIVIILIKDTKDVLAASHDTSQFVLRSSFGVYFYKVYRKTLENTHKNIVKLTQDGIITTMTSWHRGSLQRIHINLRHTKKKEE